MPKRRYRIKQTRSFEQRLADEAERFRKAAEDLAPGIARELLLRRARQAEIAMDMNNWLRAPRLQPAK